MNSWTLGQTHSPRRLAVSLLLASALVCVSASAQQPTTAAAEAASSPPTPATDDKKSPTPSDGGSTQQADAQPSLDDNDGKAEAAFPAAPEVDPYAEAKERVKRAEQLYTDGNYDAALTEFQRAYDTMLGHPARSYVLYNVGRCQEKLYRYDDAIDSYKLYLKEAGPDAEDRGTVKAKIELLEGLLGVVLVTVTGKKGPSPANYQLWVDGRLIGQNTTKFSIPSGNHEVEIRAEGFEPGASEVQVAAHQEKKIVFELSPLAKEYKGIKPTYFYVAGGLALAAGAVGGVYGVMTLNKNNDIQNKEGALVTQEDADEIKQRALLADIFLISAGVLATSATVLAFLTDWSNEENEEIPAKNVRVKKMSFGVSPSGGFLNVSGTF